MLLSYHDYLLKHSIDDKYFENLNFDFVNHKLLKEGLHHPDVPCSNLVIINNKVKYLNYNTCKIPLSLIYLFNEDSNGLEEIVQSHRGRQAIGHAMTYDPNVSMIILRQKILRKIEILYMLALQDDSLLQKCSNKNCDICYNTFFTNYTCKDKEPNIFWIGQILHCIQDSYSRAHTLRILPGHSIPNINIKSIKKSIKKSDKEKNLLTFQLIKKIGDIIDKLNLNTLKIDTNIIEFLKKYIKNEKMIKLINKNPNDTSHIFKILLFFKYQEKQISELFGGRHQLPSEKNKNNNISSLKKYPYIISFRYIDHQKNCPMFFHASYDVQSTNKIFEKYIIMNCKYILKLYKKHLKQKTKPIQEKIYELITYVSQNVFPIPNEYHNKPSAMASDCQLDFDIVYNNL